MKTSELSFLSSAEKLILEAYDKPREYSIAASEVISRVAAAILLSPTAALDLGFHTVLVLPASIYAIGKSTYQGQIDFTLPWQHLQRIRNAVAPLLLGSVFGVLHPFVGLTMSEATDKYAVMGMLSSNIGQHFETPCSPIHSLSIVENIAKNHRYGESDQEKKEIFSTEHVEAIKSARSLEKSLEILQSQELVYRITNITLFVMAKIKTVIEKSCLSDLNQAVLVRVSGLIIPILGTVDSIMALLAQAFFLVTGIIRLISGRGPIYTEVTTNPLMHASFLIQNILKLVGHLIGTLVWFISPMIGLRISLLPATLFFKLQMNMLMLQIRWKMYFSKDDGRFVIPIVFGDGDCSALSIPTDSMHKIYLIVEKKAKLFNLYLVSRPNIFLREKLNVSGTLGQIRSMLDERFPFMDIEKLIKYPVKSKAPKFLYSKDFGTIANPGNSINCVVSNMFGMLAALDKIRGTEPTVEELRYRVVRAALMKDYEFYKNGFFLFASQSDGYSLENIWSVVERHLHKPI